MARLARLCAPVALSLLTVTVSARPLALVAAQVKLTETGSTLIYPVFRVWAADYPKTHPGVTVTAAATNSGAGVEQAISGAAQIGASDAYMSDTQVRDNRSSSTCRWRSRPRRSTTISLTSTAEPQARRPNACGHLRGQDPIMGRPGDCCDERRSETAS